jgi:flagellar P-ring protein precursor FlgI
MFPRLLILIAVGIAFVAAPSSAWAQAPINSFCTIYGQREHTLTGLGLVVGLKGTGDGPKSAPTIRALAQALRLMDNPTGSEADFREVNNVALVIIQATVPSRGAMYGQKLDCRVSAISAKSLRGGMLLMAPLGGEQLSDGSLKATAAGELEVPDPQAPTQGRIKDGVTMLQNFNDPYIENDRFRLAISPSHASFETASLVADAINQYFAPKDSQYRGTYPESRRLAEPLGATIVEVQIPEPYRGRAAIFIADVMRTTVDRPNKDARVVMNMNSGSIVITGEVEIDAVAVNHKNLTVAIDGTGPVGEPAPGAGFVAIADRQRSQNRQKLNDLVEALNMLRVPSADIIDIIKTLHRSGKLHAELIIE